MRSFLEFVEEKETSYFEQGVTELLTPVINGQVSFEDLVENVILPTFVNENYLTNEQEVLNELLDKFKRAWSAFKGSGQPEQQTPAGTDAEANARYQQMLQRNKAGEKHQSPNSMVNSDVAGPINKHIQQMINQQLLPVINKIADTIKSKAYREGNKQLHRAAELFSQKLTQTAQSMKFKVQGRLSPDQVQGFKKGRRDSRYSPEEQSRLKHGASNRQQGLTDDGRIPFDSLEQKPQPKTDLQQRLAQMSPEDRRAYQKSLQRRKALANAAPQSTQTAATRATG